MATTNGSTGPARSPLRPGIYAPTMTFFEPQTEDLDIPTIKSHAVRLAKAGLVGLVTMGSNGEAVHLSNQEKIAVTSATREALDAAGHTDVSVLQGCSESSVRGTVALCQDAAKAGAQAALVLPPSYYRAQCNEAMIVDYYVSVAEQSPIPIIIYNYPGAVSGIDLDSDTMIHLAQTTSNKIAGAKFTCASTGKLARVAAALDATTPSSPGSGWMAFGGIADFTVPCASAGGSGMIVGGANVMPKLNVRVWNLWAEGNRDEAMRLQKVLSAADWALSKHAIAGTKAAIEEFSGYGGFPRRPLQRVSAEQRAWIRGRIEEAMAMEEKL